MDGARRIIENTGARLKMSINLRQAALSLFFFFSLSLSLFYWSTDQPSSFHEFRSSSEMLEEDRQSSKYSKSPCKRERFVRFTLHEIPREN